MVDRGLKTQRWFVIWDSLAHMENASLCNDQSKGRWNSRPSLAISVSVMKICLSDLIYFSLVLILCVIYR